MTDLLAELTSLSYDAATHSESWGDLNAAAQQLFRATACGVGLFNFRSREGMLCLSRGFREGFLDSYRDRYALLDVWLRREDAYRVPCTIHVGPDLVPDSELIRSRFYQEWLAPQRLYHRLSAVLAREEANLCYFVLWRPPEAEPFGDEEIEACRALAPHLRRAVQLRTRLATIERERDAAVEVLNRLPTGVVLCDETGAPVVVNEAGRQILSVGDALTLRSGKVSACRQLDAETLHNLIAGAARTTHGEALDAGGTLSVSRPSGLPLSVLVSPVRAPAEIVDHQRIAAAIFISDPESVVDTNEERLVRLYGLTKSESRLAAKIAQGRSLEQAAAMLNITTETARSYLKRILSKTGVKRQAELVRLLLLGPAYVT